jgi:hypothetical protein
MKKHEGLCFDRSRTLDKTFEFIGLPSRHVYLLYRQDRGFWSELFHYGQSSHAVTEVKTNMGGGCLLIQTRNGLNLREITRL